jgi:hypothetical protein
VSLLKDRNGEIHLDIPVSGEINDPEFRLGRVILKVIVNFLVKAATSPFALLGSLFGGGEELGYAEFAPGSADLTAQTMKRLDTLGKALHDRPALKLDIIGHADPEKDREGLKQNLLSKKVKIQKIRKLAEKQEEIVSLESITVTQQEYPVYLKRAYAEEKFSKPRNVLGIAKDLPVPEMEALILANMQVTDEDLKALATVRARAVRDHLLQSKQVEPERLYIVESGTLSKESGNTAQGSVDNCRTEFKLK